MRRTLACLGLGVVLWAAFGAVRGASYWQVSATDYLVGLAVAGALVGFVAPGRHVATGALLVAPGVATLLTGPSDHRDELWWLLSIVLGLYVAAGGHWCTAEMRRRLWRPGSRAGSLFRRPGARLRTR